MTIILTIVVILLISSYIYDYRQRKYKKITANENFKTTKKI